MADINLLIEPVTENNIVNSINIASSKKHFNNFFLDTNFIKGKKYNSNYVDTNNKLGQLKIKKFVNTRLFNTPYSIVSKAVKQKQVISLNTDNDKYMFLQNASREDLKKIKYYDYFGIRYDKESNILYDFDRRIIYHNVEKDPEDEDGLIIDKEDAEPMLDPFKFKHVFIDKHKFEPIKRYYVKEKESIEENTPQFINKQQNGVESEIIFPKRTESTDISSERERESEINTNPITIEEEEDKPAIESSTEIPIRNLVLKEGEDGISNNSNTEGSYKEPPSEVESVDENLAFFARESVRDLADNHIENFFKNSNEQDRHILGTIFSGDNDEIENIEPEDISDNLRKTLKTIKDEKIQSEKEVQKIEKDLRRTIIKYIDKYDDSYTAMYINNNPEIYKLPLLVDYFREMSEDEDYKINKRSIDAVQRRIDKLFYNYHMQGYYQDIPINQLNRLTSMRLIPATK